MSDFMLGSSVLRWLKKKSPESCSSRHSSDALIVIVSFQAERRRMEEKNMLGQDKQKINKELT